MSIPSHEQLTAALATVHDPEIKRPITELGMVDIVEVDDAGLVRVTVLLTVSGCPMKDTIDRDVRRALSAVAGVTGVELTLGAMTDEQRAELQTNLRGGKPAKEIPFAQPGSLTKVFAIASGKGGVGKSSVTVNLALALAKAGRTVGIVDADIYGHSIPAMLGHRRPPADPGRGHDHAGADALGRLGDLDRHAQAAPRPGGRLARADARPRAGADARRRLLGRPRRPAARPAPGHRRHGDLARPAPAGTPRSWWSPRRRRPRPRSPSAPARWRSMLHQKVVGVLENMSFLVCPHCGPEHRLELFGSGGGDRVAATLTSGSATTSRAGADPDRGVAARGRRRGQARRRLRPDLRGRPGAHRGRRPDSTRADEVWQDAS